MLPSGKVFPQLLLKGVPSVVGEKDCIFKEKIFPPNYWKISPLLCQNPQGEVHFAKRIVFIISFLSLMFAYFLSGEKYFN